MARKGEKTASEHEPGGDETSLVFCGNWPAHVADTCQLIFPEHSDDTPLNFHIACWNNDRGHLGVCGLKANLSGALAIEALEGGFVAAH